MHTGLIMARRGDRFGTIKVEGNLRVFLRRFEESWGKKKREWNGFSGASLQSSPRHRMIANVRWASCFPLPSYQSDRQREWGEQKRENSCPRVTELPATSIFHHHQRWEEEMSKREEMSVRSVRDYYYCSRMNWLSKWCSSMTSKSRISDVSSIFTYGSLDLS